ncbi:MAG: hypothetical protein QNJ30_16285 [Kiloniellales bacterium]|nr:hypothetical protein [Kiloniellales bacterium]
MSSFKSQKFAVLRRASRVWAIASVHGEAERLKRLQAAIRERFQPGDRLVYLGNIMGRGPAVREAIDALLAFRTAVMAQPGLFACDIAILRGRQEEMWQKLLQLQFAADPRGVLTWMLDQGLASTLEAYGGDAEEGLRAAASGAVHLTRWTGRLRQAMKASPGHFEVLTSLRRAAFTDDRSLLFVNAGLDPSRPLEAQKDSFWWSNQGFAEMSEPYYGFRRVVRGFDRQHPGLKLSDHSATLDGGSGFGGPLMAACLRPDGEVDDLLEA